MRNPLTIAVLSLCLGLVWQQELLFAKEGSDSDVVELPTLEEKDGYAEPTIYSSKEKMAACREYNNQVLSYYENVYQVENCQLRRIENHDFILNLNRQGKKILPVAANVIARLEIGPPISHQNEKIKLKPRNCKELNDKYVTFSYTDVYVVEKNCRRRPFPDWASFIEHRKKNGRLKETVLALTWEEFGRLRLSAAMPSVIEAEYARLEKQDAEVDIIPIDEACRGVNNRDVSYMDRIYRIENCRKREYDPSYYLRQKNGKTSLSELKSEQWLSLPSGKPMYRPDPTNGRSERAE